MVLYLFNLTDRTLVVKYKSVKSETTQQVVNPNDNVNLTGKGKFDLVSANADSETTSEKVSRQYPVNPKKFFGFGWSYISMPKDCPWLIYRDQVTSLILLRFSVKRLMKRYRRHL